MCDAVGTPGFMAPEVLACSIDMRKEISRKLLAGFPQSRAGTYEYRASCDWWSYAVLLYELSERHLPFGDSPTIESMHQDHTAMVAQLKKRRIPAGELVLALLEWWPDKRLSATGSDAIKADEFFRKVDWSAPERAKDASPLRGIQWWKEAYRRPKGGGGRARRRSIITTLDEPLAAAKLPAPIMPGRRSSNGDHMGASAFHVRSGAPSAADNAVRGRTNGLTRAPPNGSVPSQRDGRTPPRATAASDRVAPGRRPAPANSTRPHAGGTPPTSPPKTSSNGSPPMRATPPSGPSGKTAGRAADKKRNANVKGSSDEQDLARDWDFTSARAIAQEFISRQAAQVSVL